MMDKQKSLEFTLEQLQKEYGKGVIMRLGEQRVEKIPSISTGALTLDIALGVGGIPKGRIVEIFGEESSGKTTLALSIIANAQKQKGICAFIDAEHALDPNYAKNIGVDIENLYISQPDTGEQALDIAESLVRSGAIDVVVIDSVAALVPKVELEGDMEDVNIGLQARLMSKALRRLAASISKTNTCAIFINQLREKVGIIFGPSETTPGGRALKFYASVRISMKRLNNILKDGNVVGLRVKVKVVKNKVAPPFREAEFDIYYSSGISWESSILDVGLKYEVIQKAGAWFSFNNQRLGQGREAVIEFLKSNSEILKEIENKIKEKLQ